MSRTAERAPLTRIPLSRAELPALDLTQAWWPGGFVTSGGVRLHVRRTPGPESGGDGTTAFYIHGLGGSATNWTDLAALLGSRFPGIAIDLPGFGLTEPGPDHDYDLTSVVPMIIKFLDGLDLGPVHLFGNSLGGAIALRIAALRPDLVRTLTLVSPAMPDLRPDPRRVSDPRYLLMNLPLIGPRLRRQAGVVTARMRAERLAKLVMASTEDIPEDRWALAEQEYHERAGQHWASDALDRTAYGLIRSWLAPPHRSVWRTVLPKVDKPALVVWGTEDRLVTVRKAPRTARLLPRGRLLVLPRTGHVAQMERPRTVARAFLGMLEAVDAHEW
ncbi:alpha/beta fold hydrolase [Allokutzneria oryzae]|uniref:Alpha/beta fold hydrolase n=1 Tax=Allokutzneria oryzae TaxID=1378989 RepID=A0ABV6A2L0_9PSEU